MRLNCDWYDTLKFRLLLKNMITVLLRWSCRMHVENLGTSWMLRRYKNLISDSNKLLRMFNEFQWILFVLLHQSPISFKLWQQDTALGADQYTIGICQHLHHFQCQEQKTLNPLAGGRLYKLVQNHFPLPWTKDSKSISWWGAGVIND